MRFPVHAFRIEAESEKEFVRLFQEELINLPFGISEKIPDRELFVFRLTLEEFIVELLADAKTIQTHSRHWTTPHYQLEVELEKTRGSICFNGNRKVIDFQL